VDVGGKFLAMLESKSLAGNRTFTGVGVVAPQQLVSRRFSPSVTSTTLRTTHRAAVASVETRKRKSTDV
jgi:hypothetical protein